MLFPLPAQAAGKVTIIGTGGVTEVYYPAGGAICRLLNRGRRDHGIRCLAEVTDGSIYNLDALRRGDIDFAMVQSDWHHHAWHGTDIFERQPFKSMRTVFMLHAEPVVIAVRAESDILSFANLKGRRVSMGTPGSGHWATMKALLEKTGWSLADLKLMQDIPRDRQGEALCKGEVDAVVSAAGQPNGFLQAMTTACAVRLLPLDGPAVDTLIAEHPFYKKAVIPGGMYAGNPSDISTFGVQATLVTSEETDPALVYELVRAVMIHFKNFKTLHPVFASLTKDHMMSGEGAAAPLHEGAKRYYEEMGHDAAGAEEEKHEDKQNSPTQEPLKDSAAPSPAPTTEESGTKEPVSP